LSDDVTKVVECCAAGVGGAGGAGGEDLVVERALEDLGDEVGELDVALEILAGVGAGHDLVDFRVGHLLAQAGQHVSHLSDVHEALALTVESLEGLVEVVEGAGVGELAHGGVDGQELLQLVALLAHLGGAAVGRDGLLGGVEAQAVQHVSGLEGVDLAVTAIPEIEQLEAIADLLDLVSGQVGGHGCLFAGI